MLKSSEVIGLQVICSDTGRVIGRVKGILFRLEKKIAAALVLDKGRRLKGDCVIDISRIKDIGRDAVVIETTRGQDSGRKVKQNQALQSAGDLVSTRVFTREGKDLGYVNDILFDFETASLEGFIVSDGLVQDILTGKNIIPLLGEVLLNQDGIFVSKEAFEEMTQSGKGIRNVFKEE